MTIETVIPMPQSSPTPIISRFMTNQATREIPTTFPIIRATTYELTVALNSKWVGKCVITTAGVTMKKDQGVKYLITISFFGKSAPIIAANMVEEAVARFNLPL